MMNCVIGLALINGGGVRVNIGAPEKEFVSRCVELVLAAGSPRDTVLVKRDMQRRSYLLQIYRPNTTGMSDIVSVMRVSFDTRGKATIEKEKGWALLGPLDLTGVARAFRVAANDDRLSDWLDSDGSVTVSMLKKGASVLFANGNSLATMRVVIVDGNNVIEIMRHGGKMQWK